MKKITEQRIIKDLKNNVGWLDKDKNEITLPDAALSTIMAIIRVNLEEEETTL